MKRTKKRRRKNDESVQFPGLGLSFELSRVAFSIGDMDIYWYGVCIAFGLCLALVFAFRRCTEFGVDADSMVDVILIGVVLGIASARLYYVAMAPYNYDTIWDVLAVRDGGLAIYGGIIGACIIYGGGLVYLTRCLKQAIANGEATGIIPSMNRKTIRMPSWFLGN